MKKHLFGVALSTCLMLVVGMASAQVTPIGDIQVYTAGGIPASPYAGTLVTIEGTVFVVKGTYNSGTFYIEDETGGIQIYAPSQEAIIGDYVSVTGYVDDY